MIKEAISKLQSEMESSRNNTYVQVVGEFLINNLELNPGSAEKILDKEKSIAKSLDAMMKEAKKKKVGNYAVLTDQEGFAIVLKYFGIDTKEAINITKSMEKVAETPENVTKEAKKDTADFDIKLEDLL